MKNSAPSYDQLLARVTELEAESLKRQKGDESFWLSDGYVNAAINSLSANIAILDENGIILETNRSWQIFAHKNQLRMREDTVGSNYLEICDSVQGSDEEMEKARAVAAGIRSVIAGELDEFTTDYQAHSPNDKRWFYMRVTRISGLSPARVVISHENVTPLKLAEQALKEHETELEVQRQTLEETNTALRVLLRAREEDKVELEQKVLANVRQLVFPYLENLKQSGLDSRQKAQMEIVVANLNEIISPFLQKVSSRFLNLTPREIQVANLVKEGRRTKEIADVLSISTNAVDLHRKNVRKKLGLKHKKENLRSHLLSIG